MDEYPKWLLSQPSRESKGVWSLCGAEVGPCVGELQEAERQMIRVWCEGKFSYTEDFEARAEALDKSGAILLALAHRLRHLALMHRVWPPSATLQ